jgi:hypothetical protein
MVVHMGCWLCTILPDGGFLSVREVDVSEDSGMSRPLRESLQEFGLRPVQVCQNKHNADLGHRRVEV